MMNIDLERYSRLIKRLDEALVDEELDDIIPALISFTVLAAFMGKMDKKVVLSYFADRLDNTYREGKRRSEK